MKKLSLVVGLALISGSALASKARLGALGEDVFGSQFIDDNRNMFLNPANIHNYKNMATFEWGNTEGNTAATTGVGTDSVATPKAEGGVILSHGSMVYGLYLGDESNDSHAFRAAAGVGATAGATDTTPREENAIGAFVGGEHGVKWGASFTYSHTGRNEGATGQEVKLQDAMRTRFGAIITPNLDVFAQVNLSNRAEDAAGDKFKGKLGFQTGATYKMDKYKVFGIYKNLDGENQTEKSIHVGSYELGIGRTERLNDKVTLFTKVSYANFNSDNARIPVSTFGVQCNSQTTILGCREYSAKRVPLVVGFEADATSWLVLRGSVAQNLWSQEENANEDKRTIANTTVVNAGASLKLGDITVDGLVGNNTTGAAPGASTANGAGQLRLDSLMSRVSMTYRF